MKSNANKPKTDSFKDACRKKKVPALKVMILCNSDQWRPMIKVMVGEAARDDAKSIGIMTTAVKLVDASVEENFIDLDVIVYCPYGDTSVYVKNLGNQFGLDFKPEDTKKFVYFDVNERAARDFTPQLAKFIKWDTCACGKTCDKKCGKCGKGYCSAECQRTNWEFHKPFCLSMRDEAKTQK